MKSIVYTPNACKVQKIKGADGVEIEVQPKFKGTVTVSMLRNTERYQALIECGLVFGKTGEVDMAMSPADKMSGMLKLIATTAKYVTAVDLTRLSDDSTFSSFDDLDFDPECESIQHEVAALIASGVRPSKN